jgi:trimeric autotransporter adhesin
MTERKAETTAGWSELVAVENEGEVYVEGWTIRRRVWMAAAMLCGGALMAQSPAAVQPAAVVPPAPAVQSIGAVQAPASQVTAVAGQGGTIEGRVVAGAVGKAGGVPLPGVAITAMNSLTGRKYATTTDIDGKYAMAIPRNGRYVVRAQLTGFADVTQEVVLNGVQAEAANQGITIAPKATDFGLQLASRVAAEEAKQGGAGSGSGMQGGMQGLSLNAGGDVADATTGARNAGAALPTLSGMGDETADSVTVQGQTGGTNGLANLSEDEIRQRVQDAVAQARASGMIPQGGDPTNAIVGALGGMMGGGGGGFGGGGGGRGGRGGGGGGFGSGAFRNFNPSQPHGSIYYQVSNGALDSAQWSPTLQPQMKPSSYTNKYGVTFAESPYIPGLTKPNPKQFVFINLTGQKNLNAFLGGPSRVPTTLEREGDFSESTQVVNGVTTPVTIYDPATGLPVNGDNLANATTPISPQALALLQYYPAPNIPTNAQGYNYETISNEGNNVVALNTRYVRTLGGNSGSPFSMFGGGGGGGRRGGASNGPATLQQNINIGYNYSHQAQDQRNIFLALGGASESDGNALSAGYTVSYGRLSNHATLAWNRLNTESRNYFTNTANDPTTAAGITIPNESGGFADPNFYNGLPSLNISNFAGLTNATPSQLINQTISFSDFVAYRHAKHNFRLGLDIRRVHADSIGGNDPLGQFTFTGYATESPADKAVGSAASTGSGFADFLLGLPQSTAIQAGLYKIYLRENVYDLYANDDFRLAANWTLNYGVRYEYFAPYTEKNNRLVNLDHNADFSEVDPVQPGQTGEFQGKFPSGLVNPDRTMVAPRFGLAWKPKSNSIWMKQTVVRGGYGINYNTGQFATMAKSLSFQPPFAETQTNVLPVASATNPDPAPTGCVTITPEPTPPNMKLMTLANGFGCSTAETIQNNYSVDKYYRLGMVQAYNVNIQRTFPMGIVFNIGYSGAKGSGLDVLGSPNSTPAGVTTPGVAPFSYETSVAGSHANSLVVSVQKRQHNGNALGITYTYGHAIDNASSIGGSGETSVQNFRRLDLEEGNSAFDVRQSATGNWLLSLPFGPNRKYFNKGGFWSHALDDFSLSGTFTFSTGSYFTPSYSGSQEEASSGNLFTLRPDRVFTEPIKGAGTINDFFNKAAFAVPAGEYGTASRNSIEGPGTVLVTASLSRTIEFGGTRSFEARVTASNVFNTVQYSGINTTENSANFGEVTSGAAMRSLLMQARYRF